MCLKPLSILLKCDPIKTHSSDYKNHPCNRPCEDNSPPRLCQYKWIVESYWTLPKACLNCPSARSTNQIASGHTVSLQTASNAALQPSTGNCQDQQ
ncbi:laccase [Elysia marginata]|uniref:Laccase n=1 Tax=Elysia marginata TaxID=1093978 RepID=A0AAV4EPY6_9GAST|nr:laccase [Elysia marginata]